MGSSLAEFYNVQITSMDDARPHLIKLFQKFSRIVKNPAKYRGNNYSDEAAKNLTAFCDFNIALIGRATTREQLMPAVGYINEIMCRFACRGHNTGDVLCTICVFIEKIPAPAPCLPTAELS